MTLFFLRVFEIRLLLSCCSSPECSASVGIDYGYCDPYGKVEFAGIELKTKRGEGKDVSLNETLNVPVMEPMMSTAIKFSMYASVS